MSVTLEHVAARVGLHTGSVSRILSGKGDGYSAQTKQRVLAAAAEMGYAPNPSARALRTGATQTVALWLLSLETYSPYYGYVHHCLQRLVRQHGYQLITEDVPFAAIGEEDFSQLVRWPVDGVIACDLVHMTSAYAQSAMGRRCPIVCIGHQPTADADSICVDAYAGAKQAVEHLIASGCERTAYVCRPMHVPGRWDEPRARAYSSALSEAGKAPEYVLVETDSREAGYAGLRDYVEARGCPDGLFCHNDEIAIGCYKALHDLGIRVPDDVLMVGFDGMENTKWMPCPISSVVSPVEEMCSFAWEMLLQRIKTPEAPLQSQTLIPQLEIRDSSRRH